LPIIRRILSRKGPAKGFYEKKGKISLMEPKDGKKFPRSSTETKHLASGKTQKFRKGVALEHTKGDFSRNSE